MRSYQKLTIAALLGLASLSAFAYPNSYIPGKAHHPIHIKKTPVWQHSQPSGLTPQAIQTAYGLNFISATGKGQIIAIVDAYDDPEIENDLAVFNATFNLPTCTSANGCFKKIYASGSKPRTDAGWSGEISLDVEWAHAIAPNAQIVLVEAESDDLVDLYAAVKVAIAKGANVISMSWGGGEYGGQKEFDKMFQAASATFTASSGDSGYGVSYPASSPYVIGVGGTTLSIDANGNYLQETAWSGSGGGVSKVETIPDYQKSYPIPYNRRKRGVPDVSYNADPNSGYSVYNSVPDEDGNVGWAVVGGTSAAAPQWAAIIALANSILRTQIPQVGSLLYKIGKQSYSKIYYDITQGNNGHCGKYCNAQVNYDYVTGLGSPQALYVINNLIRNA